MVGPNANTIQICLFHKQSWSRYISIWLGNIDHINNIDLVGQYAICNIYRPGWAKLTISTILTWFGNMQYARYRPGWAICKHRVQAKLIPAWAVPKFRPEKVNWIKTKEIPRILLTWVYFGRRRSEKSDFEISPCWAQLVAFKIWFHKHQHLVLFIVVFRIWHCTELGCWK